MSYINWVKHHSHQLPEMSSELVLEENEPPIYHVGSTINGHLLLSVSKPFYTCAVRVVLEGLAVVASRARTEKRRTSKIKSDTFLRIGVDLLGEKIECREGDHRFPFKMRILPLKTGELPGSMRTFHGFITYQLVAYIQLEEAASSCQKVAEKTVTVHGHFNLSTQEASLMTPIVYEKMEKSTWLKGFSSSSSSRYAKLRVSLRLKKSGYLPGESIQFELVMKNPQYHQVSVGGVTLVQKFTYNSGSVQLFEMRSVESRSLQGSLVKWEDKVIIPVEGMFPTQNGIIEISHFLKVRISSNSPDGPFLMEAPLKIGTTT